MNLSITCQSFNMKKILLFCLFLTFGNRAYTQALSDYAFSAFSGTYTAVSGGYISSTGGAFWGSTIYDDCYYDAIPIGFTFVYCGNAYTSLSASQNCWVMLGQTFGSTFYNTYDCDLSNTTTGGFGNYNLPRPILAAMWQDVIASATNVRYATTGTTPNRVFTIEWANCGLYPSTSAVEHVQIKLYETTNIIDFAYSNISSGSSSTGHFSIGITDGTGAYPVTGPIGYWSLNGTGSAPTASMTTESKFLTGLPATNQVYRWSPQCVGTPTAGTVSASVTAGCTTYSSTLSLTGASTALGITYQWQSAPTSSGTWTNIAGATNVTYTASVSTSLWYRCVVLCTNSGLSSSTAGIQLVLNSPPAAISGAGTICAGSTLTLTTATSGVTWSSSSAAVATVGSSSGVVTGVSAGTATITCYAVPSGCYTTTTVTVVPAPSTIGGPSTVCTGTTITLTNSSPGGTWSSSAPATGSVGATTGIVTGVSAGVVTISYSIGTCVATRSVTVNTSPATISGASSVCVGSTITLTNASTGGTWSSSNPSVASVGSASGVVAGVAAGIATISYTLPGGCYATRSVTVHPLPGSIAGVPFVCVGQTTSLFTIGTGSWSSSNPSVATVGAGSGVVSGVSAGLATISFIATTGCYVTFAMSVNPLPAPIVGDANLCVGLMDTLTNATPGGIWSSSIPGIAAIHPGAGVDTGILAGTAVISYTLSTGCAATLTVTVHSTPGSITGPSGLCVGSSAFLSGSGGGAWSSSNPSVATVGSSTGIIMGVSPGVTTVRNTSPFGCYATKTITVNPLPAPISGPGSVCIGSTITLSDATPGGSFGGLSLYIITASSGVVTGASAGVGIVTYTLPTGCYVTRAVTVTVSPAPITGPLQVCIGSSVTLANAVGGGIWSSSNSSVAGVGSATGVVSGVATGVATISYSLGSSCYATRSVTVNPLPGAISGPGTVCMGSTLTLSAAGGGTWASSNTSVATIGSTTGVALGVAAGTSIITYTLPTGCSTTKTITVNPLPSAITGASAVCVGATITLASSSFGGTWSSSSATIATVGATTGIVTGVAPGVATITYFIASGCSVVKAITVNALPSLCTVSGGGNYCAGEPGLHVGLTCSSPGVSYQLYLGGSPVGSAITGTGAALDFGLHTGAGTYTVVATNLTTGCSRTMTGSATIGINPLPAPISGPSAVCVGSTISLTDATAGGTWASSTPSRATIGALTGIVTGVATGTTTITYTLPTTCKVTMVVTVSPAPAAISGPSAACVLNTMTLTNAVPGGAWTSGNPFVALIGSLSGLVTGIAAGTSTITYSLGTGCNVTKVITVNPSPLPITGSSAICIGQTTTLSSPTPGIVWASMDASIATVTSTGIVVGVGVGTATIICSLATTGCYAAKVVTVNPLPAAITGPFTVCVNSTTTLTNTVPGGTWTSASPGIASVGASTGVVTGIASGTALITYSLGTGCIRTTTVTVNPVPAVIGGPGQVCIGLSVALTSATPGGAWSTTTPSIGTVSSAGIVTGISAGIDTIIYTLPITGCRTTREVTVNPLPAPISGSANICVGQTSLLTNTVPGGVWSSGTPSVATVSVGGIVTGVTGGTSTITYTAGGCYVTTVATVIASPAAITGSSVVCIGGNVTLTNPTTGGTWSSSLPSVASITGAGVVSGIASGTTIISYTLGSTGCTAVMPVAVNAIAPISGSNTICVGQMAVYIDTALSGTWSSSNPSVASISGSGWATGITTGTTILSYTRSGCVATKVISVNPIPAPILGGTNVCVGLTTLLTDATPGGTWSSSNPVIGSVNALGIVTGVSSGSATISYTLGTGCARTQAVSVFNAPPAISGPSGVCIGHTILLTDVVPGGVWSSSSPAIGSIASTGVVTGISAGVTTITYMLGTGCSATKVLNVDNIPPAIIGPPQVCVSSTATLSNTVTGGTWSSGSTTIATVDASTGVVTGVAPGVAIIFYNLSSGCSTSTTITVNALPSAITGSTNVCTGATTTLSNSISGGIWSSSAPAVATVVSSGPGSGLVTGVSSGTAIVTYTLPTGCSVTATIIVNNAPLPITGSPNICIGLTTNLSSATSGGTWSSSSPAIAPVDAFTGIVTGAAIGTAVITYTVAGSGCNTTLLVSVNPFPAPIIGGSNVCTGATLTLSNAVPGGTWSSSSTMIATVVPSGPGTATVTGVSAGPATIVYSLGSGCSVSLNIFVDPAPLPIIGANNVCATQTTPLASGTPGGTWSSTAPAVATISSAGMVLGVTAGSTLISYTNSLGCAAVYPFTVNQMPSPISGSANVCLAGSSVLTDSVSGGIWFSTNPSVAAIGSSSGVVAGITLGTTTIRYTLPNGCFVTKVITVHPLPLVFTVTGGGNHCDGDAGVHVGLSGSTVGVNYMLYLGATAVGAFAGTGSALDFGLHTVGGIYTVKGTSTVSGCSVNMVGAATIGVIPTVTPVVNLNVTPDDTVCTGTTATFLPVVVYGGTAPVFSWSVNGIPVSVSGSYAFVPADGDVVTVTMTSNAICPSPATVSRSVTMEVQPFALPTVSVALLPNDTVCKGAIVTASAVTTYAGSAPAYTWFKNGALVSYSGSTYSFPASNGDEMFCILTSNHPCRLANVDSSTRVRETVVEPALPVVTISALPGTTISKGQVSTLTANVTGAVNPTYQWFINGHPVVGATNAAFVYSAYSYPNPDSVSCAVISHDVCEVTTHKWVYINVVATGVGQMSGIGGVTILPNPNKGEFTIKGQLSSVSDEEVTIELANMLGQVVHRGNVIAKGGALNEQIMLGSNLANGMYLLTLRSGTATGVFHVVVEK